MRACSTPGRKFVSATNGPICFRIRSARCLARGWITLSEDVSIGMTAMHMRETPAGFLTRVAIGNEPVNNTILGFDANIRKDAPVPD